MFFDKRKPRIIASDPWAFLEHLVSKRLRKSEQAEPIAFIEQAYDFYEAATNPQLGSKPVLYYYSFLNLVKVFLRFNRILIPAAPKHGINDPRANIRERFRIQGQRLHIIGRARDRSQLFAEFIIALGGSVSGSREIKLLDVLAQIPSIHRAFTQVTSLNSVFVPIKKIELRRKNNLFWGRVILDKKDQDVACGIQNLKTRSFFRKALKQVASELEDEIWLETDTSEGERRGVDSAIYKAARKIRSAQLSTILTQDGYRYYFNCIKANYYLHPLTASLAAMFYLGSITRYKPEDFGKIRAGKYGWICEELIGTQPKQFLYILCSELADVDVVIPHSLVTS